MRIVVGLMFVELYHYHTLAIPDRRQTFEFVTVKNASILRNDVTIVAWMTNWLGRAGWCPESPRTLRGALMAPGCLCSVDFVVIGVMKISFDSMHQ